MEHRCTPRVPLETDLYLYQRAMPVTVCRTGDISPEGVFVRLGQGNGHAALRHVNYLEIGLTLEHQGLLQRHRIPVLVVHRSDAGIGLMFINDDPVVNDAIRASIAEHDCSFVPSNGPLEQAMRVSEARYAG